MEYCRLLLCNRDQHQFFYAGLWSSFETVEIYEGLVDLDQIHFYVFRICCILHNDSYLDASRSWKMK